MKTCLIYGHNGLDLDVTFNLLRFYKKLGLSVFYSDKLYDADILVVVRATDVAIDLSPYHFSVIHVFDYGGWDYDAFIESIDHSITTVFCTSEEKKRRLISTTSFPESRAFVALPPVIAGLWTTALKKTDYNIVHIGNYKPIKEQDTLKERFQQAIIDQKAHIWGMNWENIIDASLYHGRAGQFSVSGIYSKAAFSFGFMYPFQRDVTYSGRFWHAPLNGCQLFSEPGLFANIIPGVIETDYSFEDLSQKIKTAAVTDRQAVQTNAIAYWNKENEKTRQLVTASLSAQKNKHNTFKKLKNYLSVAAYNKALTLYHRSK